MLRRWMRPCSIITHSRGQTLAEYLLCFNCSRGYVNAAGGLTALPSKKVGGRALSEEERATAYPGYATVHSTVELHATDSTIEESKRRLALGRRNKEYDVSFDGANPAVTIIRMDGKGLSCSSQCAASRIRSGCIPLRQLQALVGDDTLYVGDLSVRVAGETFPMVACYHRSLPTPSWDSTFTVGDASAAGGKDDRCCLDAGKPFHFYWDKSEHGLITLEDCLRHDYLSGEAAPFTNMGKEILFREPFFDLSKWSRCPQDSMAVKMEFFIVKILSERKESSIKRYMRQLGAEKGEYVQRLRQAFASVPGGSHECQRIDELLLEILEAESIKAMPRSLRREIYDVIAGMSRRIRRRGRTRTGGIGSCLMTRRMMVP